MLEIEVVGWSEWGSKFKFSVDVIRRKDGSVEEKLIDEMLASEVAERLERELRWVSENVRNVAKLSIRIAGEYLPEYTVNALIFLAAARANVNPAHITYIHIRQDDTVKFRTPRDLRMLVDDIIYKSVYWPGIFLFFKEEEVIYKNLSRFMIRHGIIKDLYETTSVGDMLDKLAEIISRSSDEPDVFTVFSLAYILDRLSDQVRKFRGYDDLLRMFGYEESDAAGVFERAAREVSDPDVKRLAEILSEMIVSVISVYRDLDHLLVELADNRVFNKLRLVQQRSDFIEFKEEVVRKLREAAASMHQLQRKLEQLKAEAYSIIERLKKKGPLLDMELESEEEIKKRLLEA